MELILDWLTGLWNWVWRDKNDARVIAIIAIVISIFALRREHLRFKIDRRREKDRVRDSKTATLQAVLKHESHPVGHKNKLHTSIYLVIKNTGQAAARNIDVELDGRPWLEHKAMPEGGMTEHPTLGPGAEIKLILYRKPPNHIALTWNDDSGEPGKYDSTLL